MKEISNPNLLKDSESENFTGRKYKILTRILRVLPLMAMLVIAFYAKTGMPNASAMTETASQVPAEDRWEYLYPNGTPECFDNFTVDVNMVTNISDDGYESVSVRVHRKLEEEVADCLKETREAGVKIKSAGGSDVGTDVSLTLDDSDDIPIVKVIWQSHGFYTVFEEDSQVVFSYLSRS